MLRAYRYRLLACVVSVLFFSLALAQPAARRLVTVDDMSRFLQVRDPQVSPEGKWVAYVLGSVDLAADKREAHIWMANWDGTQQLQLTAGAESDSMPRWSPDGRYLAFLSARKGKDKTRGAQVWLLDRMGGEARQLTQVKGTLRFYSWSPDSKRLVLVMGDRDPNASDDAAPGAGPAPASAAGNGSTPAKAPKPIVIDRYHFKQDTVGYLTQKPARLYLFDIATKKNEALTPETLEAALPAWSPDGKRIAFLGQEGKEGERYNTWNIYVMDAHSGAAPKPVTRYDGILSSASRQQPEWSPDGERLAYLQNTGAKNDAYNMDRLAVVAASGGEPKVLTSGFDRPIGAPRFTPHGASILFTVEDDRSQYPALIPANGGPVRRLLTGKSVVFGVAQGKDGRLAVLVTSDTAPAELAALENGVLRPLTHHNDALLAQLKLGATEEFSCQAKDGNEVHGLLVKPPDYQAGRKYPTLLRIHGGPDGQDAHAFNFERQIFAANGYVVVAVNYRGSSGRGEKYQTTIFADWGDKEVTDLLAAMDYVVSTGLADPDRLGIGGWSYGGILTDFMIAKDHRFKAAISGAGSALPLALYGLDQYIMQYDQEIGPPWKVGLEPWIKISYPFLHANQINTPTLFLGGDKDFNVPLAGGEEMYEALRSLSVPTQLVIYPGERHFIARPSFQKDRIERYLAWYGKYLKSTQPGAAGN